MQPLILETAKAFPPRMNLVPFVHLFKEALINLIGNVTMFLPSGIDDLILNSEGFLMGYGIYLLIKTFKRRKKASA